MTYVQTRFMVPRDLNETQRRGSSRSSGAVAPRGPRRPLLRHDTGATDRSLRARGEARAQGAATGAFRDCGLEAGQRASRRPRRLRAADVLGTAPQDRAGGMDPHHGAFAPDLRHDERVATHSCVGKGHRSTIESHLPQERASWRHRSQSFWQARAQTLGGTSATSSRRSSPARSACRSSASSN